MRVHLAQRRTMLRALILTTLALASISPLAAQATSVLRVKVVLVDAEKKPAPVPRHALLISDTPPSTTPRRVFTGPDGTVEVALRPGLYTVESDRPVVLDGKGYQWTAMVEVAADRAASLELTLDNAETVAAVAPAATDSPAPAENDPSFLLTRWQETVVAVWTPTTRASGLVVDARGLVATTQRAIGDATVVAVQLTPAIKLAARVLVVDPVRDVAILRVDATAIRAIRPLVLECTPTNPPLVDGQDVFTIGAPFRGPKTLTSGTVTRVQRRILVDWRLSPEGAGGPVFTAGGALVGITSVPDDITLRTGDVQAVSASDGCEVLRSAEAKLSATELPSAVHLPVEPARAFPGSALDTAANLRAGVSIPYQMSSSDFDIAFITPVLVHSAARRWKQSAGGGAGRSLDPQQERVRLLTDFGSWSDYFKEFPSVLVIRVTPKLEEGFWTKVARGAAQVQGVTLPPMKRVTSGFSRVRVSCGSDEVAPIQPFELAHRIADRETVREGLYVFDAGALGPHCGNVRLTLYAQKEPDKADSRVVDPKILQLVWEDFAPYRSLSPPARGGW